MSKGYSDRILEIHGANMWNMFYVDRAIDFAKRYRMTGIIFHANDLIDKVVFPEKYFSKEELLKYNPVRNSVTKSNRYYLRSVLDKCNEAGLEFYAEVKEIYFNHDLITKYPELRKADGALCPTDPFWWEFLEAKYDEFFALFPDVAGISVSPGTRESMVSLAANRCTCDRCKDYDVDQWYQNLLRAIHNSISRAGKRLIVRDFSYTKSHQFAMVYASESVSDDITMSLKMTPHDYYPVFPDNPAIGNTGKLKSWVEYDAWGQFFGLGVFPYSCAEDMQGRMKRYYEKGANGVTIRTDWENMSNSSVYCSFNMLNLVAGAMLSYDVDTPMEEIYKTWASEVGLYSPLIQDTYYQEPCKISDEDVVSKLHSLMLHASLASEKALHIRGHVFNRNSQIFDRFDLPFNIMTVFHSRDQWEKDAHKRVEAVESNIPLIIEEKEEALRLAEDVKALCGEIIPYIQNENIKKYLEFLQNSFVEYILGFKLEAETLYFVKMVQNGDLSYLEKAKGSLAMYDGLALKYKNLASHKGYSGIVEYMLDGDRLLRYKRAAEDALKEALK